MGPDGPLEVHDPPAFAREAGDEKAARAWELGFPAKKELDGRWSQIQYMLLDADAIETMRAATTILSRKPNEIEHSLRLSLRDCKAAQCQPEME
ncbi:hypothetical protein SLS64_003204 [Diaporthe eres]